MKIEIRDNTATIEGYVNAVERESRVLHGADGDFIEVVKAGTFGRAISENKNIELRFNHRDILGSTAKGDLELKEDNIGLYAKAKITDINVIDKARKGELRGWSFGFVNKKAEWERNEPIRKRYLEEIELREVSILDKTPAYIATSIEMRGETESLVEHRLVEDEPEVEEMRENKEDKPSYFFAEKELELIKIKGGVIK